MTADDPGQAESESGSAQGAASSPVLPRAASRRALDLEALAQSWRERMDRLRAAADPRSEPLALLGYEPLDLDGLLWSSSHPGAIRGAGALLSDFDRANEARPLCVFAGGGRGLELVPRARAAQRQDELARAFRERSGGGVLVSATVPYDAAREADCVRWLRLAVTDASEEAPAPAWALPTGASDHCSDCAIRARAAGPTCAACAACLAAGGKPGASGIAELGEHGRIAAICAGGGIADLLAAFDTLEAIAAASGLVLRVLDHARASAAAPARGGSGSPERVLAPDAIAPLLALVPPSNALRYVGDVVRAVQSQTSEAVRVAGWLPEHVVRRMASFGLAVGIVVLDAGTPIARGLHKARTAQGLAQLACRTRGWRSAVHIERVAGCAIGSGAESGADAQSHSLEATSWRTVLRRAGALRRIPGSQRADVRERALHDEEFWNRIRFQVARSPAWKRYYRMSGADWRDPQALRTALPDRGIEILAEIAS